MPTKRHYTRKQIAAARKNAKTQYGVRSLLSHNADPKTSKSNRVSRRYETVILYMAPARIGGYQSCGSETDGCAAACLYTAGNPIYFNNKEKARIARKRLFFEDRETFFVLLYAEIAKWQNRAAAQGKRLAVRLNGTSDIVWETVAPWLFATFPRVQFYDYTKHAKRFGHGWKLPRNYDLTFSRSESNGETANRILQTNPKAKVAIVFSTWRDDELPQFYAFESVRANLAIIVPVDNGDTHDMTFIRPAGVIGLRAKGDARKDDTGFVIQVGKGETLAIDPVMVGAKRCAS